jgi:hypothetical protein
MELFVFMLEVPVPSVELPEVPEVPLLPIELPVSRVLEEPVPAPVSEVLPVPAAPVPVPLSRLQPAKRAANAATIISRFMLLLLFLSYPTGAKVRRIEAGAIGELPDLPMGGIPAREGRANGASLRAGKGTALEAAAHGTDCGIDSAATAPLDL